MLVRRVIWHISEKVIRRTVERKTEFVKSGKFNTLSFIIVNVVQCFSAYACKLYYFMKFYAFFTKNYR